MLRRFVVGYAEWLESSGRRAGHPTLRTDDVVAVDESSAHLLLNHSVLLRPLDDPARAETLVADLHGFFGARDGGAFSVFNPWAGPVPPGLTVGGHPPFMLRVPGGERPAVPPGLELVEVDSADLLAEYEQVLVDGFPLESLQPWQRGVALHESVVGAPGMRCFIGRVEGRAVTVATSIVSPGLNHVEWVATLPDARGRGYGAAVTWEATLADPTASRRAHRHRHGEAGLRAHGLPAALPVDVPDGQPLIALTGARGRAHHDGNTGRSGGGS